MSLDPKTIYIAQRTDDGLNWREVYISGSNLILQTDSDGYLSGSFGLQPHVVVATASYAISASYSVTSDSASYIQWTRVDGTPNGLVSSSAQILNSSNVYSSSAQLPSGIISSSLQVVGGLVGTSIVSSSAQTISNIIGSSIISSSLQFPNTATFNVGQVTAAFSGELTGTSSWSNNSITASYALNSPIAASASWASSSLTASYVSYQNVNTLGSAWVSSSAQILVESNIYSSSAQLPSGLISGSNQVTMSYASTASYISTASWANDAVSSSYSTTASFALNFNPLATASYTIQSATASYVSYYNIDNLPTLVSSSAQILNNSGVYSSSLQLPVGIVSSSIQTIAGLQTTGIYSSSAQLPLGIYSGSSQLPSGIVSSSAQVISNLISSNVVSSSLQFDSSDSMTLGQLSASSIQVDTLHVLTITSSVVYASGSNIIGSNLTNIQQMTGSVEITGSLEVNGIIYAGNNTISGTSSYAITASYVKTATTSSYVSYYNIDGIPTLVSSSAQILNNSGIYSSSIQLPGGLISGSGQVTMSYATTASYSVTASYATNFNPLATASYAIQSVTASYVSYSSINGLPTLVSSSAQILNNSEVYSSSAQLPNGLVSSSVQIISGLQSSGIYSSSAQLPSGIVSSSAQVLSGSTVVSSSLQFTTSSIFNVGQVTASVLGKLTGTASWANTAMTASYVATASYAINSLTASYALSSSITTSQTASYVTFANVANKPTLVSASAQLENLGGLTFTAASNVTLGQITASIISASFITASNMYVDTLSVNAVSMSVNNLTVTSLINGTSSYAITASYIAGASVNSFIQGGNSFGATASIGTNDAYPLIVRVNSVPVAKFEQNGDLFIGSGSWLGAPAVVGRGLALQGYKQNVAFTSFMGWGSPGSASSAVFEGELAGGTSLSSLTPAYAGANANFSMRGYDGTLWQGGSYMSLGPTQTWSAGSHGANIKFNVVASGSTTITEAMRIDSTGFVGIGTSAPTAFLHISGSGGVASDLTVNGRIRSGDSLQAGGLILGGPTSTVSFIGQSTDQYSGIWMSQSTWVMQVSQSGYVGLGVCNSFTPQADLHISGGRVPTAWTEVRLDSTSASGSSFNMYEGGTKWAGIQHVGSNNAMVSPRKGNLEISTALNGSVDIRPNDISRLYISSSGAIGIGTQTPLSRLTVSNNTTNFTPTTGSVLHIVSTDGANQFHGKVCIDTVGNNAADYPSIALRRGKGTTSALTPVQAGDTLGAIWSYSSNVNGNFTYAPVASMVFSAPFDHNAGSSPTSIDFYTVASGSISGYSALHIDAAGRVGVNTTAPSNALDVVGSAEISGSLFVSSSIVTGGVTSSAAIFVSRTGTITTQIDGYVSANGTTAIVGVPVQISPRIRLQSSGWDVGTSVAKTFNWSLDNWPVSAATASSYIKITTDPGTGTFGQVGVITDSGCLIMSPTVTTPSTAFAKFHAEGSGLRVSNYIRNATAGGYSEIVFDNDTAYGAGQGCFVLGYGGTATATSNQAYFFNRRLGDIMFGTNNTERMRLLGNGNLSIGLPAPVSASAYLHIKAGTTVAGTSPIKFTSGSLLTVPESGSMEFDGTNYWVSPTTTRYMLLTNGMSVISSSAQLPPGIISGSSQVTMSYAYTASYISSNKIDMRVSNISSSVTLTNASPTIQNVINITSSININLPSITSNISFTLKKSDTGSYYANVISAAGQLIDGYQTQSLTSFGDSLSLVSNITANNWIII